MARSQACVLRLCPAEATAPTCLGLWRLWLCTRGQGHCDEGPTIAALCVGFLHQLASCSSVGFSCFAQMLVFGNEVLLLGMSVQDVVLPGMPHGPWSLLGCKLVPFGPRSSQRFS